MLFLYALIHPMKKEKVSFYKRLKKGYRLSIYDKSTLNEVHTSNVSRFKVLIFVLILAIFFIGSTVSVYHYTPLKKTLPGYPADSIRNYIIENAILLDSLKAEIDLRDHYLDKIQSVIKGDVPKADSIDLLVESISEENIINPINEDSIIEQLIETGSHNFNFQISHSYGTNISEIAFFTPIKGMVSQKFKAIPGHLGIDIVALNNTRVSAILDGIVILADWTLATGYVMVIRHENELISVYKHNAELLKLQGEKVSAGEAIAIMGNSGEVTTGPHLHFELWANGQAVDPELYINFQND